MTKVKLRKKPITGNRHSLYLDFWPPIPNLKTGKQTRRDFLELFTYDKPKTPVEKDHNRQTLALAETIKGKRQIDIQNGEHGFLSKKEQKTNFVEYYSLLAAKRKASNHDNWVSAQYYLEQFTGGVLPMNELNEKRCIDFRDFLLNAKSRRRSGNKLAQNTALSYFNKFKAALKQAYRDGLLKTDLNTRVKCIKAADTNKEYLIWEELEVLVKTDCQIPVIKQAGLFSSMTGLRHSDLMKLTWKELQKAVDGGHVIKFTQKKTNGMEVHPISDYAFELLGERGEPNDHVFNGLTYSAYNNRILKDWVRQAGIDRHITFHCFRHTYAVLLLDREENYYKVSQLMGHRSPKTTIDSYAKIIDKRKREAANWMKID